MPTPDAAPRSEHLPRWNNPAVHRRLTPSHTSLTNRADSPDDWVLMWH